MQRKVLVYQSHTDSVQTEQTLFSVVSLLSSIDPADELEVQIYTDQADIFSNFFGSDPRIQCREITKEMIHRWKGPEQYDQRLKIALLKEAGTKHHGPIFYCDSDTYFRASPMPYFRKVNERTSILFSPLNALDQGKDALSKKLVSFVKKHHFQVRNELVGIGPSIVLWNTATIGLCQTNKYILDHVLDLADQSYSLSKKDCMEQLAFSFFLQTRCEILATDSVISKYSKRKKKFKPLISRFLKQSPNLDEALKNYPNFAWPAEEKSKIRSGLFEKVLRHK